jgi:hypothetical protein
MWAGLLDPLGALAPWAARVHAGAQPCPAGGHPQEILTQLMGGRGPLGLPGGANGPKNGSLWGTQGNEISSRRVDRGA